MIINGNFIPITEFSRGEIPVTYVDPRPNLLDPSAQINLIGIERPYITDLEAGQMFDSAADDFDDDDPGRLVPPHGSGP